MAVLNNTVGVLFFSEAHGTSGANSETLRLALTLRRRLGFCEGTLCVPSSWALGATSLDIKCSLSAKVKILLPGKLCSHADVVKSGDSGLLWSSGAISGRWTTIGLLSTLATCNDLLRFPFDGFHKNSGASDAFSTTECTSHDRVEASPPIEEGFAKSCPR
eukprot:CAMPEP_0169420158 /NCGR_PEP_ID=MMETSP1017-20121227/65385_1 /TAXON_ID=342587 /ORGANISM="Karlodinium micrum, Strain CCMP2283" /LENGTH=160 /DNA_ID=CAMNT_0009528911 /DNA_START=127 /DNA_END=609 /DNA_ORIENTATION=-